MFGKRRDGWLVKDVDPLVALTPYFMPMRCDAQVMMGFETDFEKLARYIVKKGGEGYKISFMDIIIAAYVRTVSELPEINRFIANKRIYARNEIVVSFAVLQRLGDGKYNENTIKCKFDPRDTIYDVSARLEREIAIARKADADNLTMQVVRLLRYPIVANIIVWLARFLDRYGLLPKIVIDASPFHTGLFLVNMASIGMPAVRHHIYNFGTTPLFVSMGANQRSLSMDKEGNVKRTRVMPLGVVADERVCSGYVYSQMVSKILKYIGNPHLLETPPETVTFDEGHEFGLEPIKKKRRFFRKRKKLRQDTYNKAS